MILDMIVKKKKETVKIQKHRFPLPILLASISNVNQPYSFFEAISKDGLSIIGEVKQASPSKGIIREQFNIRQIVKEYSSSVDCISVLTEEHFFKGSPNYLKDISAMTRLPLLRKDFIVDPYQIYESKYLGASCILLIASLLDENKLKHFNSLAYSLGLDTIIEVHNRDEIAKAMYAKAKIIGINNRNLNDFSLNINRTLELRKYIPNNILVVSESGISNSKDIHVLRKTNIDAILVGEGFMRSTNIQATAKELIEAYGT